MPLQFVHESRAQRVVLARGRAAESTAAEIARLGAGRVLLVMAEGRESDATRALVGALPVVERWVDVRQHVPEELADRVAALATEASIDAIVSVGGGSATGLAKGIALATGIPIIAVPTTYSGSEATDIWGLTAPMPPSAPASMRACCRRRSSTTPCSPSLCPCRSRSRADSTP